MAAMPSTVLDRLYKPGPRFFYAGPGCVPAGPDSLQKALELFLLILVLCQEALDLCQLTLVLR